MTFYYDFIFEQNTSKIKNRRLICKNTNLGEDAYNIFKDQLWLFIWEFSETIFMAKNDLFYGVIFEKNTSKIINQRLICKTTDLKGDAHSIFKDQHWPFYMRILQNFFFYGKKWLFLWRHFWKKYVKNQRLICKTTDLGEDAYDSLKNQHWPFYMRILQNYFLWQKMTFFCDVIFEKKYVKT